MGHSLRLYGHRGASALAPENTLLAFERAIADGADALELDLRLTADGHVVVSHDPTGARMCGVRREIRSASRAEVRAWDAGFGFRTPAGDRPYAGCGVRIPTLEEVLERFPGVPVNADLKSRDPPMVAPAVAAVRRARAEDRVLLTSFRTSTLAAIRAAGYAGPTGLSAAECLGLVAWPSRSSARIAILGASAAQMPARVGPLRIASRALVERCHALGLRVDFFTVNEPAEARALLGLGADGVMTDDPARLASLFSKADKVTAAVRTTSPASTAG